MSTAYATRVRSYRDKVPLVYPHVVPLILVGLAYFTFAHLGLRFASINPSATPIWPPTGLAIAAVLLWGHRIAPAIFVAAFLVNQFTAGSIFTSLGIASGNTLEALIAGYLATRWSGEQVFDTPTGIAKFALISLGSALVSATIGVSSLTLAGHAEVSSFISVWVTWWLGDWAGALIVAPVVVLWAKTEPASLTPLEIRRTAWTCLAAAISGVIAFGPLVPSTADHDALSFLVILLVMWTALSRGPRDTATAALIICTFVVSGTAMGFGPFAQSSLNDSFLVSLAFMISLAVLSLALSTDVSLRRRIENQQRMRALQTELLWQATVQVSFGGSVEDLVRGCLKRICQVAGWPVGHVYLPDANTAHRFFSSPIWHFEREELTPLAKEVAGNVLEFGEKLPDRKCGIRKQQWLSHISERASEPMGPLKLKSSKQILLKHGLCASFGFPIYAERKLQAVMQFFSTTNDAPDTHLLYVVQSIGEQLGRVLERQRGVEQQRQAMALSEALNLATIRSGALEATLNALTFGVYLTDRDAQIVYMNPAAKDQITRNSAVRVKNNHFALIDHTVQLALVKAIEEAIDHQVTDDLTIALPAKDSAGLIATVFPLGEHQGMPGALSRMAAIFVQDPIAMPASAGVAFAKLYNLTQSELRVLLTMAPGLSVKEAAQTLGICETTAKTHLQHIYSKTGISKRTELMHLVMSSTPPVKSA